MRSVHHLEHITLEQLRRNPRNICYTPENQAQKVCLEIHLKSSSSELSVCIKSEDTEALQCLNLPCLGSGVRCSVE